MRFLDEQYFTTPFYGVERLFALLVLMGYRINRKRLRRCDDGNQLWKGLSDYSRFYNHQRQKVNVKNKFVVFIKNGKFALSKGMW